jgi:hypothetical protein
VLAAALAAAAPATALNPQHAGLQVALRAQGLYLGAIDAIIGPKTLAAVRAFQRTHGLPATGIADVRTRRELGPLGTPLFGSRALARGRFGWDVAVLQFLLARSGQLVPVSGYFDHRTERALRRFQRSRRLAADGVAGHRTLAAFTHRSPTAVHPVLVKSVRAIPAAQIRGLLDYWARRYGVDRKLVRAVAWMESGYQTNLTSRAGAWGVMQILPPTWHYVETVLLGRKVAHTASGNIRVGVLYLRQLLRQFKRSQRLALGAWYQGPASVRRRGLLRETKIFVANVLALETNSV